MNKADAFAQAGKLAVMQNIQGTMEFLQKYPPFNQMESAHLAFLVEHCLLRFYAAGESIIKPQDGPVEHFYIVKQGRVVGERPHSARRGTETTFEIASGECFPLAALLGERATRTEHLAGEDTFCLLLGKSVFVKLFALSNPFRDFALRGVSSLLDQVNQQVQLRAAETLGAQYSLDTRLGELADNTASSSDEEGDDVLEPGDTDIEQGTDADVTPDERKALENVGNLDADSRDDEALIESRLDDVDNDGDPLNEEGFGDDYSGKDLDVPGTEDDDLDEEIGEEDEENNSYSVDDNDDEGDETNYDR